VRGLTADRSSQVMPRSLALPRTAAGSSAFAGDFRMRRGISSARRGGGAFSRNRGSDPTDRLGRSRRWDSKLISRLGSSHRCTSLSWAFQNRAADRKDLRDTYQALRFQGLHARQRSRIWCDTSKHGERSDSPETSHPGVEESPADWARGGQRPESERSSMAGEME
jgi:hypothetical protein